MRNLKTDSKLKSISESFTNIICGFPINWVANLAIIPFYVNGFNTLEESLYSAFEMGIWFTMVSVARTYFLRRLFNRFGKNENFYTLTVRGIRGLKNKIV